MSRCKEAKAVSKVARQLRSEAAKQLSETNSSLMREDERWVLSSKGNIISFHPSALRVSSL